MTLEFRWFLDFYRTSGNDGSDNGGDNNKENNCVEDDDKDDRQDNVEDDGDDYDNADDGCVPLLLLLQRPMRINAVVKTWGMQCSAAFDGQWKRTSKLLGKYAITLLQGPGVLFPLFK